jgi:hypothetical protein
MPRYTTYTDGLLRQTRELITGTHTVQGKIISVLSYVIKHYAIKTYGKVKWQLHVPGALASEMEFLLPVG